MGFLKLQFVAEYEKIEGGPFGDTKYFRRKTKNEHFEQFQSAENVKGGHLGFFNIHYVVKKNRNK